MVIEPVLILSVIIIALAVFGQCLFGFGGGLIAIPVLSLMIGVKDAVTLSMILQMISVGMLIRIYSHIDWSVVLPVAWGLIPGTLVGVFLLTMLDEDWIRLTLIAFIASYLIKDLFYKSKVLTIMRRRWSGVVIGSFGGIIQGLIGTGGPPLVMYLNELKMNPSAFRAALLIWICVTNTIRLIISVEAGLFNEMVINIALASIPFILLAMWSADRISKTLNDLLYARAIQVILCGSIIALII